MRAVVVAESSKINAKVLDLFRLRHGTTIIEEWDELEKSG
jgi:hypothetical protein